MIAVLSFSCCEFDSKTKLSQSLPLCVELVDGAHIKSLSLYKEENEKSSQIVGIEHYDSLLLTSICFDNVPDSYRIAEGHKDSIVDLSDGNYHLFIKTDKGYASADFTVMSRGNQSCVEEKPRVK